jgi:6-phosphogluconolactonase
VNVLVYVANGVNGGVSSYSLDHSGQIELTGRAQVPGRMGPLAIAHRSRRLYAAVRTKPWFVVTFGFAHRSGILVELARTPLAAETCYLEIDRTERYLLQASYPGSCIAVNRIGLDGWVQSPPIQFLRTPPHAHSINLDRSNRFVLVPSVGGDCTLQFTFDAATGRLQPNQPHAVQSEPGSGPRHLRYHPNGRFAYLVHEHDATLTTYSYDAAFGTLTELQRVAILQLAPAATTWAADLRLTPDGRFLYATERGTSTISMFRIDPATGMLEALGYVPTEAQPRALAIDPRGRWLLSTGEKSDRMTLFAVDRQKGTLAAHTTVEAGPGSHWIEVLDD